MKDSQARLVQELVLYAASAALSSLVLFMGLRHLDPNRDASKKALAQKKEIAKRLGRPLIQTNQYEDIIACDVINPDHIEVEFDSIGGLEKIKNALYELVILPLKRPELFSSGKLLTPQKGVLLYGPPGTGKTMLAKALAKESGAVFINVRMSNLMSKWFGDAQKLVTAVFTLAYKLQPAIIFIDEVDSFLGQRRNTDHEVLTNMKTEFMSLWDGFTTDRQVNWMKQYLGDSPRPLKLEDQIKVILKAEKIDEDIAYDNIARQCEGFTGSDIFELCKHAAYIPVREFLQAEKDGEGHNGPRALKQSDLEKALSTVGRKDKRSAVGYQSSSQSPPWAQPADSDDSQVQNAIFQISKIMSDIMNNQSESHDP
ncbi:hypothetical protein IEQ34_019501 [Dendrobium chrysotoxum]|uniref:AAA+ ATPase domain-containing protein n=1 Tax=Dendrobium chrysotoxum TaxID=161865 RepID=A0AAV7G7K0_DENCH|nr:hypothetical protein IEQ34_019501 [Dendrobium chrysotoxum]